MKNRIKSILCISIVLIIIITISVIYILQQYEIYKDAVIAGIDEYCIIVKIQGVNTPYRDINEHENFKYITFSRNEIFIKDSNGHKININELKIGDTIQIIRKKPKFEFE